LDTQLIRQLRVESKIIIRRFGMENNKKEDMVFVSFDRLWDNFKKYWWIAAVLMALMLLYGAATYSSSLKISEAENDESKIQRTPVTIAENEADRIHCGLVDISFNINLEKYYESIGVEGTPDFSIYQTVNANAVSYAGSIATSQGFYDFVNSALTEAGYSELVTSPRTPTDNEYDIFTISLLNDKTMSMSYTGLGGVERIRTGAAAAASYIAGEMEKLYPYITCAVASEPTVTLRVYVNGFYTYIQPDDASIKATLDEYAEYNRIVTGQIEKFDFRFAYIFKMSTIIKGAVGFVIGLFIIFVIAICDRKVRTREELERFFEGEGEFLGEFKKNVKLSENITAASIGAMCEKSGVDEVLLTTVGRQKNADVMQRIAETASTDKVKFTCVDGIEVCAETSRDIAAAQGIIIMVNGGYDEVHTIKTALARVNTVNGNILGYILCK